MRAMRAEQFSGYKGLKLVELPNPAASDGKVLLRMTAVGVTPLEHTILFGRFPIAKAPLVLGSEGAGVVAEGGGTEFPIGSRVMFTGPYGVFEDGAYGEWLAVRKESLCPIPEGVSDVSAAGIPVAYLTAQMALALAGFQAGKTVLAPGRTLADELGNHAIFSRLDVTSEEDWTATVAAAEDAFGPVSVLINNAGIVRFGRIEQTEPAAWRQVIDINLTGSYLGIRAVVPSMRKTGGGAIVNTSAGAGMTATFGVGAYAASKWAVRGMTKTAALEVARDNIRVNSIHPGNVLTPMVGGSDAAAAGAGTVRHLAIARIAEPEEITRLVLFIASDEASSSTGSEFIADGGQLLGPVPG